MNPYKVLGISRDASLADVKTAYFKLVREHPPERDPDGFRRIREAYEALRTPAARAETDRQLLQDPPPYMPPRRLPTPDLAFHPEDVLVEARRSSDLERTDFTSDFRPLPDLREVSI
jgi:curved DNA-binding protein CbpA